MIHEDNSLQELKMRVMALENELQRRDQVEKELLTRQKYLESVLHHAPDAIVTLDHSHRIIEWNPGARKIFGYSSDEARGKDLDDLVTRMDVDREARSNTETVLSGQDLEPVETVRYRKDGTPVHVLASGAPFLNDGTLQGVVAMYVDITEQKRAEEVISTVNTTLQTILDSIPADIYVCDMQTYEVLFMNEHMKQSFGQDCVGEICWRAFRNGSGPCDHCTNAVLLDDHGQPAGVQTWEGHNPVNGKWYINYDRAVPWTDGRYVRIQVAADITERKEVEDALRESELRYRDLVENCNDIIFTHDLKGQILSANSRAAQMLGHDLLELQQMNIRDILLPAMRPRFADYLNDYDANGTARGIALVQTAQGEQRIWEYNNSLRTEGVSEPMVRGIARDVTEQKRSERELQATEEKYRTVFENTGTATVIIEEDTTLSLVNAKFESISGYSREEVEGKMSWTDFVVQDDLEKMMEYHRLRGIDDNLVPSKYEFRFQDRHGQTKDILLSIASIPGMNKSVASLLDITHRIRVEEKLRHQSFHDALSGLYNRNFFEEEMRRLQDGRYAPVGIIICDLDGLKFVNDTMGHESGDQVIMSTARLLRANFRSSDIIARIGGDEFAILLTGTDQDIMQNLVQRLRRSIDDLNSREKEVHLSLSIGFALSHEKPTNMQALFKEADNRMYREKMHRDRSTRSVTVQALMKTLEARDFITEGHSDRLQQLVVDMAQELNLPEETINDLRLLAQFHDLGKVGISDDILFKPGSLTAEERKEMQRHCEIGQRIAQSVPDLEIIADWILKHHEWWNGQGYPLGLQGEDIPLPCRILAIADAYDAMTEERPYRNALSHREAVEELRRCAGQQFDPSLVDIFLGRWPLES